MADGTLSRGAETLASAITIGVKPAKSPMSARARKSCQTDVTSPIRATITTKPISDRISIIRSEEHTSELQSLTNLVCRLLLEKKKKLTYQNEHRRAKDDLDAKQ